MRDDPLVFLGLMRRAGRLALGDRACAAAIKSKEGKLLCVASDVSPGSEGRIRRVAEAARTPVITLPWSKARLGALMGRETCGIAAVTDVGFAENMVKMMALKWPDLYGEKARLLCALWEKEIRRKRGKKGGAKSGKRRMN